MPSREEQVIGASPRPSSTSARRQAGRTMAEAEDVGDVDEEKASKRLQRDQQQLPGRRQSPTRINLNKKAEAAASTR